MMRSAVYLLGSYPVWSETFLRQDLDFLLKAGLPLHPVALFPGDTARQTEWPEVQTLTTSARGFGTAKTRARPQLWLPPALRARLSLLAHRRLRLALRALTRERGAGHVHAEFADLPALLASAVAGDLGITYSVSVHAHDVHQPKFSLPGLLDRAQFVTACNFIVLQAMLEACPRLTDRAHLIPHGVDLRTWTFRTRPFTPHDELRLFFAGRFVEKKGLDTLLRAAAQLQQRGTPVNVSLAGSGPLEGHLRALAAELGLGTALSWLGVLTPGQVRQAFDLVDALVVPSRVSRGGDRDGIPNIVLEAMAVGLPVVGTGAGGLLEVLTLRTGWRFPPDDHEALATVLQAIARDPQSTEQRRLAARTMVEDRYDAARLAEQRAGLFYGVLSDGG